MNREEYNAQRRLAYCGDERGVRVVGVVVACVECGAEFVAKTRAARVCSRRCKDLRYAAAHPKELRAKLRRKEARRRARLKGLK